MLLWLILRTLKYSFVTGLAAGRYIWYLYYLPMLFLPLLWVYIALSMGKSEDYRLSRGTGMLSIIPAALFLLVITNDLHQQGFAFKSGVPGCRFPAHIPTARCILSALAGWWSVWLFPLSACSERAVSQVVKESG